MYYNLILRQMHRQLNLLLHCAQYSIMKTVYNRHSRCKRQISVSSKYVIVRTTRFIRYTRGCYYMRPRPTAHKYMHTYIISPGLPSCIANAPEVQHQLQGFLQFLQLELRFM